MFVLTKLADGCIENQTASWNDCPPQKSKMGLIMIGDVSTVISGLLGNNY